MLESLSFASTPTERASLSLLSLSLLRFTAPEVQVFDQRLILTIFSTCSHKMVDYSL